jgi:hypothetical protein
MDKVYHIKIYNTIDKSVLLTKNIQQVIGSSIHESYNSNGNEFYISKETGFIKFILASKNQIYSSKLNTKEQAESYITNKFKQISEKVSNFVNNHDYYKEINSFNLFSDRFSLLDTWSASKDQKLMYWNSIYKIKLKTGLKLDENINDNAILKDQYVIFKYTEQGIIEMHYNHLPIISESEVEMYFSNQFISGINKNGYIYYEVKNPNQNLILPYFYDFYSLNPVLLTTAITVNHSTIDKIQSADISKINIKDKFFKIKSIRPKSSQNAGMVEMDCTIELLVIDKGDFAVQLRKEIDPNIIAEIFNNIYSSNDINAKLQNNSIYVKEFDKYNPILPLSSHEKSLIVPGGNFKDYYQININFMFNLHVLGVNIFNAITMLRSPSKSGNLVIISTSKESLKSLNSLIQFQKSDTKTYESSGILNLDLNVLLSIIQSDLKLYYNQSVGVGIYYERFINNNSIIEICIQFQIRIEFLGGINIEKLLTNEFKKIKSYIVPQETVINEFQKKDDVSEEERNLRFNGYYVPFTPIVPALNISNTNHICINPLLVKVYPMDTNRDKKIVFNGILAHEINHILSLVENLHPHSDLRSNPNIQNDTHSYYPDYTLLSNKNVRAWENDIISIINESINTYSIEY